MANNRYDSVAGMADAGQLNWSQDRILGLLVQSATFNAAHTRVNQIGATQVATSDIPGRYMGSGGQAMGLPASFPRALKDVDYQVLLVKDVGDNDPLLVAFYDRDESNLPLRMTNNGMFILRPVAIVAGTPPEIGMWLQI